MHIIISMMPSKTGTDVGRSSLRWKNYLGPTIRPGTQEGFFMFPWLKSCYGGVPGNRLGYFRTRKFFLVSDGIKAVDVQGDGARAKKANVWSMNQPKFKRGSAD
jgi:hypothetical protein